MCCKAKSVAKVKAVMLSCNKKFEGVDGWLFAYRALNDWSQKQLACVLGVSVSRITGWEKGKKPHGLIIRGIAAVLEETERG